MIPATLEAVTPALLTDLLAERFPDADVEAFERLGEAHGTATKALLAVRYRRATAAPPRFWIKGGWEPTSEILRSVGIFSREPRVYAQLLPVLAINAPRCLGARWDEARLDGVLLLEDLDEAGAVFRRPDAPVAPDEAEAMLAMLATMHGAAAGMTWRQAHHWLRPLFSDVAESDSYLRHIRETAQLETYLALPRGEAVPSELRHPEAIQRAFDVALRAGISDLGRTMIHGDAHIGNTYLGADGRPGLLDWQCVWWGSWAFDVAYYLASALSVENRRTHERPLLAAYLERLAAAGGPRLTPDEGLALYRAFLPYGFLVWLANSTTFQPEAYNAACAGRFGQAMVDHGLA